MSSRIEALAAAALGCFGFWALASGTTLGSGFTGSFTPRFGVDGLTAFFLGMLGLVAAPTLAYASRYFDGTRRGRANSVLTGAFVLVLAEVLCARDPISFLAGWELMTLLPAAIILVSRSDDEAAPDRLPLSRDHPSGGRVYLGRRAARRRLRGLPLERCRRAGLGASDRDRTRCSRGHGHQGGVDADAQLAPACAPDRTGTGRRR